MGDKGRPVTAFPINARYEDKTLTFVLGCKACGKVHHVPAYGSDGNMQLADLPL